MTCATSKGLIGKNSVSRLFGRNTYPTDNPGPHRCEFYLTDESDFKPDGDLEVSEIPSGLHAVLMLKNLYNIKEAYTKLWKWIEESPYEHIGWKQGNHGWVGNFEEHLNWKEENPQTEWFFDLWVKLKE